MSTSAACSICSDCLTRTCRPEPQPGEPAVQVPHNVNAMMSPCGHAFHAYCITRWLLGATTCPNCRKAIPAKKCFPLFLDTYDTSLLLETTFSGDGDGEKLKAELLESDKNCRKLKMERDRLQEELTDLRQTMEAISNENGSLVTRLDTEKIKSEAYMLKYHEAASYKSYAQMKENELKKVQEELDKLTYLQDVVAGVRRPVESDMKTFSISRASIKSLVEVKNVIQQELENVKLKNNAFKSEKEADRKELLRLRAEISRLQTENEEMDFHLSSKSRIQGHPFGASSEHSQTYSASLNANLLPPKTEQKSDQPKMDVLEVPDDDVGMITALGKGLKRSRSNRLNAAANGEGKVKRSASTLSSSRFRFVRDSSNEPLSPLNMRCRTGIPGLAIDGIGKEPKSKQPWKF